MLLQLHGVPISSNSQQFGKSGCEPRSVVGRGLRRPAVQRQLQAQHPSGEGTPPAAERKQQKLRRQDEHHQLFRRPAEQVPALAVNVQPCAESQLSTATEVDMLDADTVGLSGASSTSIAAVDVPSMVAAVTALLAEVCSDRSSDEVAVSAQRYVRWLTESTSGARQQHPAAARLNHAAEGSCRPCSPAGSSDQPQQFHVQFTSQV